MTSSLPALRPVAQNDLGRSRNASAQARRRAKRKAYIKRVHHYPFDRFLSASVLTLPLSQLEQTVTRLQATLDSRLGSGDAAGLSVEEFDGVGILNVQSLESPNKTPIRAPQLLTVDQSPNSPIFLNSEAPACRRLISCTFSSHEIVSLIDAIFESQNEVKAIHYLRGDDAQTFIDVIHEVRLHTPRFRSRGLITFVSFPCGPSPSTDQALDLPDLPLRLRKKCLSALCKICGRQALLPRSLQIQLCYDRSDTPQYRGGYADVWKGKHRGHHVAVKVLRIYSTSDYNKIVSVGSRSLLKSMRRPADTDWRRRGSARKLWYGWLFAIRTCCHCWG